MNKISIALDGPSGAGKSTLARMTAQELGLVYVDTGAIYRSVALYALRRSVGSKDEAAVEKLLAELKIEMRHDASGLQRMIINGEDVTEAIRTPEVSLYASDISAMPAVRRALIGIQRSIAAENSVIMDGRDIGTVVLPNADLKIFLTAAPEERARRRWEELAARGIDARFEDVLDDLIRRDANDTNRAEAPLKPADDAVMLDTTGNTLEDSLEVICRTVRERLGL